MGGLQPFAVTLSCSVLPSGTIAHKKLYSSVSWELSESFSLALAVAGTHVEAKALLQLDGKTCLQTW